MSTWYRQGTISVTNGNATVTGIGTAWGAANTHTGDVLLAPDGKLYEILSIDSVTQLTIKPTFSNQTGYQGTTDTSGNAKYAIAPLVGSTTTADLAQRISAILTAWQDRQDELSDWQGGTVTGGDGNGYYPLTDSLGAVTHVMCPAKITSIVGNLDTELTAAQGYATSAQSSATSAQTYASQAGTSATNAGNSASAANTSATNANNSATSASSSAATATTKASEASSSASAAAASASAASASATNANNSAIAAAATAASINPSSIAITGGTINNTAIGSTTPSTGAFTTLSVATGDYGAFGLYRDLDVAVVGTAGQQMFIGAREGATWRPAVQITGTLSADGDEGTFKVGTRTAGAMADYLTLTSTGNLLIGTNIDDYSSRLRLVTNDLTAGNEFKAGLVISSSADITKVLSIGYSTSLDVGVISAVASGVGWKPISIAPVGGHVLIGTTTDDGVNKLQVNGGFAFAPSTTTTAPAAGGAGALPATPLGYATITINGTARKIAYYA